MIEFAWPLVFLLLPLPWLAYKLLPSSHYQESAVLKAPQLSDFALFQKSQGRSSSKYQWLFLFGIWLTALTAAARPQSFGSPVALPQNGRDLMLAVDLSGSMQSRDYEIKGKMLDRLSALKLIASDFIERRQGDRIGLILFGSQAYLQAPLTFDLLTVKQLLMEAAVGLAGSETAIGDAIGLAVKQLRERPKASRVLILATDGNNNAGELTPDKAAEIAAHEQLKIHTIAIGSKPALNQSPLGLLALAPHASIDEETLKRVAEKTGGLYFHAYNANELAQIYHHIDQLEKHEASSQYYRPVKEIYYWPLLLLLGSLALLICIECSRRWQR